MGERREKVLFAEVGSIGTHHNEWGPVQIRKKRSDRAT